MSGDMCAMMGLMGGEMDGGALQMRGEMLKAMGEIVTKSGKILEAQPR